MAREPLFEVLYEDEGLLAINKPPGLACHPTKGDAWSSLISRIRMHLGESSRPHLINRLDRETSGIVIVAKQDDLARKLRQLWEERLVTKNYLAIVHGKLPSGGGLVDAPLGRDESSEVTIKDCVRADGAFAQTAYRPIRTFVVNDGAFTLTRIIPTTGRKHQIRIHMAYAGYPIVGDKIYGVVPNAYLDFVRGSLSAEQQRGLILSNQALHAEEVSWSVLGQKQSFRATPSMEFQSFAGLLSGETLEPSSSQADRVIGATEATDGSVCAEPL